VTEPRSPQLAVRHYAGLSLADGAELVNLAWTSDERPLLGPEIDRVLADALAAHLTHSESTVDGYGGAILGPALRPTFGLPDSVRITAGPGVGPTLSFLARLVAGRRAYVIGNTYPDFPYWVSQSAGETVAAPADRPVAEHAAAARRCAAAVIFLERPSLTGDWFADAAELARLCAELPDRLVLVDESNANYCPHEFSAVRQVSDTPNLVVIRGLSKAYGLGGLRLGYCVSSAAAADRLRQALPPGSVSRLSLELGAAVLALGDRTAGLRSAVRRSRLELAGWLAGIGLEQVVAASEHLPYLLVWDATDAIEQRLTSRGIRGKRHPMRLPPPGRHGDPYRLSVPLAADRVAAVRQRLTGQP